MLAPGLQPRVCTCALAVCSAASPQCNSRRLLVVARFLCQLSPRAFALASHLGTEPSLYKARTTIDRPTCCHCFSCAAINGNRQLRAAKDAADVSYGQLHVAAAMLHVGAVQPPGEDEVFMDLSRGESLPVR